MHKLSYQVEIIGILPSALSDYFEDNRGGESQNDCHSADGKPRRLGTTDNTSGALEFAVHQRG